MSNPIRTVLLVCTLTCAASALTAQTFEGVIRQRALTVGPAALAKLAGSSETPDTAKLFGMSIDSLFALALPGMPDGQIRAMGTMTQYVKGTRFRIEGGPSNAMMPGSYAIVDKEAGTMTTVMPGARQALVLNVGAFSDSSRKALTAMAESARAKAARADTASRVRTPPKTREIGKRTIRGFAANGYETLRDDSRTILWAAPELADAKRVTEFDPSGMMRALGAVDTAQTKQEPDRGFTLLELRLARVPRMLAGMIGNGYSYNVSEVLSVERGPVADSLFVIPADYSKMDMNSMMSSMRKPPAPEP